MSVVIVNCKLLFFGRRLPAFLIRSTASCANASCRKWQGLFYENANAKIAAVLRGPPHVQTPIILDRVVEFNDSITVPDVLQRLGLRLDVGHVHAGDLRVTDAAVNGVFDWGIFHVSENIRLVESGKRIFQLFSPLRKTIPVPKCECFLVGTGIEK